MNEENSVKIFVFWTVGLILIAAIIVGILVIPSHSSETSTNGSDTGVKANVDDKGNQVVNIKVTGSGYSPKSTTIAANRPATIKFDTNNGFGCAMSVVIPKLNVNKQLSYNSTNDIQIPSQKSGTTINGTCIMGMFSFLINVS